MHLRLKHKLCMIVLALAAPQLLGCAPRFYRGSNPYLTLGTIGTITFIDPQSGQGKISYSNQSSTIIAGRCTTGTTVYLVDGSTYANLASATCAASWFTATVNFSSYPEGSVTVIGIQRDSSNNGSSALTTLSLTKETTTCSSAANRVAGSFPLGTGVVGDPYIICTAAQLTLISGAHCTTAGRALRSWMISI